MFIKTKSKINNYSGWTLFDTNTGIQYAIYHDVNGHDIYMTITSVFQRRNDRGEIRYHGDAALEAWKQLSYFHDSLSEFINTTVLFMEDYQMKTKSNKSENESDADVLDSCGNIQVTLKLLGRDLTQEYYQVLRDGKLVIDTDNYDDAMRYYHNELNK